MTAVLRTFVFAWQFLTAIPLSRSMHDAKPDELAASMSWYPLVGCLLGVILVAADLLLAHVFSAQVTSMLLMLLLIGITRGLHQDGLADMVDGLAGGRTSQARLAIMRDGHIGAIGATGLFLALGLRYAGLTALPAGEYHISNGSASGTLSIRDANRHTIQVAAGNLEILDASAQTKLVFHRYGSRYFLAQLWIDGNNLGREVPISRQEREMAKRSAPESMAVVAVSNQVVR